MQEVIHATVLKADSGMLGLKGGGQIPLWSRLPMQERPSAGVGKTPVHTSAPFCNTNGFEKKKMKKHLILYYA